MTETPPPYAGGQMNSASDVEDDGKGCLGLCAVALLAFLVLAGFGMFAPVSWEQEKVAAADRWAR